MSKTIAITGAGSGLGRALALRFAAAGYRPALLGRTPDKLQRVADEIGEGALPVVCDVRSPDSVRAAFATIADTFDHIDILINNAALVAHGTLVESSDAEILDSFATNAVGPMLCARAAIPMMGAGAHIFSISSGAVDNNYPEMSVYASSKAGLERFCQALAEELKPAGIRVTAVRCGQMVEEIGKWEVDPATAALIEKALAAGWDPRDRPSSAFASVASLLYELSRLPADLAATLVTLKPRKLDETK